MTTLKSLAAALAERRQLARHRVEDRDQLRGYAVDKKRIIAAYLAESVIVAASLYGAWLFANFYGHNDWRQIEMMMLAPVGYAVIEFCRVPLAVSVRTHTSGWVRILALIGVVCASGVTVKSMSQLGEIMFRPRLFDVVHAKEDLGHAQSVQATVIQRITAADAEVDGRRVAFNEGEQRAKSDAIQLANLPKDQCHPTSGVTTDGRPWKGQKCTSDPRIGPLRDNLKMTIAARDDLAKRLEAAVLVRSQLDRTPVDRDVATADVAYREAILHSQLHSFTGMVFGEAPTAVSDEEIYRFLRIFVFFPSIFVAFASTLIAFTAVHKVAPALIPFDPEGTDYLLEPLYKSIIGKATEVAERTARTAVGGTA